MSVDKMFRFCLLPARHADWRHPLSLKADLGVSPLLALDLGRLRKVGQALHHMFHDDVLHLFFVFFDVLQTKLHMGVSHD